MNITPSRGDTDQMDVSADDFAALFTTVSTWGHWGETDERAPCTT